MATAKINTQHDYVTLRVEFEKGQRVNLTLNRRGTTGSGTIAELEPVFHAFDAFVTKKGGGTNAERFEAAKALAEKCATPAELIAAFSA